jgi:hypothetical protein
VKFQVIKAASREIAVLWVAVLYSLVEITYVSEVFTASIIRVIALISDVNF